MSEWKKRTKNIEIPGMDKLKKIRCTICGKEFVPNKEEKYCAKENRIQGGLSAALSGSPEESRLYDCFDCPVCGCQIVAKERLRKDEKD